MARAAGGAAYSQLTLLVKPPNDPNVAYVVQSADLRPDYNLATTNTVDDGTAGSPARVTKSDYGSIGGAVDPAYGLGLSSTEDPGTGHLNLVTSSTYEAPRTAGKYLRQLTKTLPGGNTTTYAYYGDSESITTACPSPTVALQSGLLSTKTNATGSIVEHTSYDVMGREVSSWINSEASTCTAYDSQGRVAAKSFPASSTSPARTATYNYAVGADARVSSVSDPSGTVTTTSSVGSSAPPMCGAGRRPRPTTKLVASRMSPHLVMSVITTTTPWEGSARRSRDPVPCHWLPLRCPPTTVPAR